jgi:hypothetical protein
MRASGVSGRVEEARWLGTEEASRWQGKVVEAVVGRAEVEEHAACSTTRRGDTADA